MREHLQRTARMPFQYPFVIAVPVICVLAALVSIDAGPLNGVSSLCLLCVFGFAWNLHSFLLNLIMLETTRATVPQTLLSVAIIGLLIGLIAQAIWNKGGAWRYGLFALFLVNSVGFMIYVLRGFD